LLSELMEKDMSELRLFKRGMFFKKPWTP